MFNCRRKVAYCLELRRHQLVILYGCIPLQRLRYTHHYASWCILILGATKWKRGIVNLRYAISAAEVRRITDVQCHSRGMLRRGGPRGVGSARSYAVSLPCSSPRRQVRKQLPRIFTKLAPRTLCNTNGHRVASRFCLLYASSLVRWKFPSKPPKIIGDLCKPRLFRHLAYGLHVISYSSRTTAG